MPDRLAQVARRPQALSRSVRFAGLPRRPFSRWNPAMAQIRDRRELPHLEPGSLVELLVLASKETSARCRVAGSGAVVIFRGWGWEMIPGEIVELRVRKSWRFGPRPYVSGEVERTRLDVGALGLVPLELRDEYPWDPAEEYWGEEGEPLEDWAAELVACGPRPSYEMEQVIPGLDPEDWDSDPIVDAAELGADRKRRTS
jgi:hypothetical protein